MYPFGHLPGNLVAFCRALRQAHGFRIGPGELRDAARALELVDLSDERRVRDALRTVLSSSHDTAQTFDAAFDAFFFPGPPGTAQVGLPSLRDRAATVTDAGRDAAATRPRDAGQRATDGDEDGTAGGVAVPAVLDDESAMSDEPATRLARATYSPLEAEGAQVLRLEPVDAAWRAAARALVRRLHVGLSRRWRPASRGRRFDFRRTWRASLQTGGEAVTSRWLRRVNSSPHVAIFIDGSRSMGRADAALHLAVALAGITSRLEVFVFSTSLRAVTHDVRRAAAGALAEVPLRADAWGGGTNIGASLREFLQRHGDRHVRRDTLVIIASDGLDVGEPSRLRDAMRELHRRAVGIVWLNPLVDSPGYEPTSQGMAAARPFVTTLASVPNAEALAQLARVMRLR